MTLEDPAGHIQDQVLSALGLNAPFVVDVYSLYRVNPETVTPEWRAYFRGLEAGEISPHTFPRTPATVSSPDGRRGAPGAAGIPGPAAVPEPEAGEEWIPLRGGAALVARNMDASRELPTATSYRHIPVKVLEENRRFLNLHRELGSGGKISFTHLIAWAVLGALEKVPGIKDAYAERGGEPHRIRRPHIHLGVAVDLERKDGTRNLVVPVIRDAGSMNFRRFVEVYDETIRRTRAGTLDPDDFRGATVTLTNPGTVGTAASVPRLMPGQGAIVAVGSIGYSAETRAMSPEALSRLGFSKQMTVSCTYDHRIIQGALSGLFLGEVEHLLRGEEGFYDRIFEDLHVPYHPVRWTQDVAPSEPGSANNIEEITRQARVLQLINAYRVRGHLIADLDPLGHAPHYHPELDIHYYGLTLWDLDRTFITGATPRGSSAWEAPLAPLREILETIRAAYGGKIGIEYMNIQDPEQKRWIQARVEPKRSRAPFPPELRRRLLTSLIEAEVFEQFLQARYMGHKRFSLEGGETLIPILDQLLEEGAADGVEELVLGMAHRGRLNVLTQTVEVDPARVFSEFQGNRDPFATQGSGDVKYHLGTTGVHRTGGGREVRISLAPNPSHLEAVDPVVEGIARAKQERLGAEEGRKRILPVLIHGDAAFAGQGVVAETLNLSQLRGYRTGGTVHLIVNNQIGFTTPVESARSSPYPTDVAKMGQAPIFHVNGDDPEAATRVLRWALAFRQTFHKDVVIDMFCYRRHGHNEGDEPSYTQPRLYQTIRNQPSVAVRYARRLVAEEVVTEDEVEAIRTGAKDRLEDAFNRAKAESQPIRPAPLEERDPEGTGPAVPRPTRVGEPVLGRIIEGLLAIPEGLDVHPKLRKGMQDRRKVLETGERMDWATAEALAMGSLVLEGVPVRLSGQDSVRGTFSQRHLLLHDDDTDQSWMGLQHLSPDQAPFVAVDSPLSEEAVLGFEIGYSIGDPGTLVLWEAQFGDFVNEAQVAVDQFLAGAQAKWGQPSGVVLLLPHGYEGQGPDHSSARLERFLQVAAEDNIQVAYPTTPAQYFHLLRRQMCEGIRKPLVVMTPKSLLRNPRAVSRVVELTRGAFLPVLADPRRPDPAAVERVVLCSGKVFYDLGEAREAAGTTARVALVRIEQLYPFPEAAVRGVLDGYPGAEVVWAQEEPRNMGAWMFVNDRLRNLDGLSVSPRYVGRRESASTATGYHEVHTREQARLAGEAVGF